MPTNHRGQVIAGPLANDDLDPSRWGERVPSDNPNAAAVWGAKDVDDKHTAFVKSMSDVDSLKKRAAKDDGLRKKKK